jgi:3-methyladenine DNA glycosylase AlkD
VEFYERKPKKNWFLKAEDKVCWEQWVLSVTLVSPRTDSGACGLYPPVRDLVDIS